MAAITDQILSVDATLACLLVFAFVFAEDALFVGFVLPGETAAILGGVIAHEGQVSVGVMIAVVVSAAILGDSVGYEVGRKYGQRLLETRYLQRHSGRLDSARRYLRHRGAWAVVLGRFTAFFRAVMPALAGLSRMPYPKFLAFNALGGAIWGTGVVLLGYYASHTYESIAKTIGRGGALTVVAVVLALLGLRHLRERRREHRDEDVASAEPEA